MPLPYFLTLLPVIVKIVNRWLMSGVMLEGFKMAMVLPILKKPHLVAQILNNYRPVSNLPFLSKVVECVVAAQLTGYLTAHSLTELSSQLIGSITPLKLP